MTSEIGRRSALRLMGAAPLAAVFTLSPRAAAAAAEQASCAVKAAASGQGYVPMFFDPQEWKTVRVLVDRIIPSDERSGSATDAGVPEFMDFLMSDPTDSDLSREARQTAMRGGLAWINSTCARRFGRSFVECPEAERVALLDEIAYHRPEEEVEMRAPTELQLVDTIGRSFFDSFRDLTASGFWSSKIGVEDLQYKGNTFVAEWQGPPPDVLSRLGLTQK